MNELKGQLRGALIVILTMAAVIAAGINFQQQKLFRIPEDGVTWVDRGPTGELSTTNEQAPGSGRVVALFIVPGSQGDKAGLRASDVLRKINGSPIQSAIEVTQALVRLGAWSKAEYYIERGGVEVK